MATRDHNQEFQDNSERKYAYEFDEIVRDRLLRRLSSVIAPEGPALELGAYKGDMTRQLLEYHDQIDVVEASDVLADEVRARFGDRVNVTASLFEDFEPNKSYKNIYLVHTLEHLDDPVGELERMGGWLATDGLLVVVVPNANALSRQIAVHMGIIPSTIAITPGEYQHGHRRTYSLDTLLADVRSSGLEIVDFGGIIVKPLANYQFDQAMAEGIVTPEFVDGCDSLSRVLPDLSSSIFVTCKPKP